MSFLDKIFKGNTLYYPGCLTKFALKEIEEKYKKILQNEGIEFIMLSDKEVCCGSPVKNAGEDEKFAELARKNLRTFKEHGVTRLITNCPACALVFKVDYKKALGDEWDIEVRHVVEVVKAKVESQKLDTDKGVTLKTKNQKLEIITYHDPCHLGRGLGIYDQPRAIIKKAGYEIKEMELTKSKSFCCGGGGGVKSNCTELSNEIAKDRIEQAKRAGAGKLITCCPMCYANLKENGGDFEVEEISELL